MTPARYTHGYSHGVMSSHTWRTVENSAAYLLPYLTAGSRLLDVGCGPGTITVDFARRLGAGAVTGIDPEASVIARARAAATAAAVPVDFAVADLFTWQLPAAGRYDLVHAHQVLQHLGDPVAALTTMRALTAPGGIVAARDADYGAMFWYPEVPELSEWQSLYREVAQRNGGQPDAARYLPAWAHAAGFDDIAIISESWCFTTPDDRQWWASLWAERTLTSGLADGARAAGLASQRDLERIAAGWSAWAADPAAVFVVPHLAIVCHNTSA